MLKPFFLAFISYVILEGALRKWVWPEHGTLLFAIKDLLLFGGLSWLLLFEQRALRMLRGVYRPMERAMWLSWVVFVLIAFVISGPSFTSFVGLRYFLCALPLLVLFPVVYGTSEQVVGWLSGFVTASIPICLLGFAQFLSPPDSPINSYSWTTSDVSDISTFGDIDEAIGGLFSFVRVTGTFSYISTYSAYLQFAFFASLALFVIAKSEARRLTFAVATGMLFVNVMMNGSRAPLITSIVLALPFLRSWATVIRRRFGAIFGIALGAVILALTVAFSTEIFDAVLERNANAGDAPDRIAGGLFMPYFTVTESGLVGAGLGKSFLGLGEFTAGEDTSGYIFDESRVDRIGTELGSICYLLVLFVKIYWFTMSASCFLRSRNQVVKMLSLMSLSYQMTSLWQIPVYNSIANIFYFLSIALVCVARREEALSTALAIPRAALRPALRAGARS